MIASLRYNILFKNNLLNNFVYTILSISSNILELPTEAKNISTKNDFELKAYRFPAKQEQTRKPRLVKVGAIQSSIALATTEPIEKQREAIWKKITNIIKAAAAAGVNVLCMQEAWSKLAPFNIRVNNSIN